MLLKRGCGLAKDASQASTCSTSKLAMQQTCDGDIATSHLNPFKMFVEIWIFLRKRTRLIPLSWHRIENGICETSWQVVEVTQIPNFYNSDSIL
mmetsp:Transcript_45765/g.95898  ORF Transcript_45765/g.95898 Transcript_45765/m.95898 type:complete len:94 (+) Transcript_45765:127-408(+)